MATTAIATTSASTRAERYLDAERRLWQHYGLEPRERYLDLRAPAARLRVLEVGSGEPILFVHGTVGPGAWASWIPSSLRSERRPSTSTARPIRLARPSSGAASPAPWLGDD